VGVSRQRPIGFANHPAGHGLAEQLRKKVPEILALFESWVRKDVASARSLKPTDLKNSLPALLENLAQALERAEESAPLEVKAARAHGKERSTFPQYSLEEVIAEYRLLRRAIFEVLKNDEITSKERDTIIDAIEIGISEAASEFASRQYQLREQFISMLAHDLRNPLTAAKMSAQLVLRGPERVENVRLMAARIVDTIGRTDRMIRDLLDSNLVRMGQTLPLEIHACDLRELIQMTMEEVASVYGDRFEFEGGAKMIQGYWDPSILQRALANLLVNAIKYGDKTRPVKITVTEEAAKVEIAIHNYGNPIASEALGYIFDNFRRETHAQSSPDNGWGIGLYLVKGAVAAHGGDIRVQSQRDVGTTFTIRIPKDCRPQLKDR
jgi:signal transduction histidine kinase